VLCKTVVRQNVECITRGGGLSVELDSVLVGVLMLELSELFVLG